MADPADVALIDLDGVGEQLASGEHHPAAELVQPRPRGPIAPEAEHPLQPERGHALLLVHDVPDRGEPAHQRRACPGEDRAGRDRRLRAT